MFKIISLKKYRDLMGEVRESRRIRSRLSELYWLSEFDFMKDIEKWLSTGEHDGFYNAQIHNLRVTIRRKVLDHCKRTGGGE